MQNKKDEEGAEPEEAEKTLDEEISANFADKPEAKKAEMPRTPGVYSAPVPTLADKIRKLYFAIKTDLRSDNRIMHDMDSIGTSIDLGPEYYRTAAMILKSAYDRVKQEAVRAKMSEMYSLLSGAPIEKKS